MRYKLFTIFCLLITSSLLYSQNSIDNVVKEVEANNTTLVAFRKQVEAEKLENRTGLTPSNPELGYNYLWGKPSDMGNRTDFSVVQSIDFPTAYAYRSSIANRKNDQLDIDYERRLREIQLETRLLCIDLIYINALKAELSKRLENSRSVANAYQLQFEAGEKNILENNKAQLDLLNTMKQVDALEIERLEYMANLARLNGGKEIHFDDSSIKLQPAEQDFEKWYALAEQRNPALTWLQQEIEISNKQVKLNNAMGLPKLTAGYMSEKVTGEQFQGITMGITIPLWENKNNVKFAKARSTAVQSMQTDYKRQYYNSLKSKHQKALALATNVSDYREKLQNFNNSDLLKKALDAGEISLIEYMLELSLYYDSVDNLLQMERDYHKTLVELEGMI